MENTAVKNISKLILSPYYLADRSFLSTSGVSRTEINDDLFALEKKLSIIDLSLPSDFIELLSTWNGFNISFLLQLTSASFLDVKFKFEIFSFGKYEKGIRKFYDVNSEFLSSEYLLIGYSDCYSETINGNSFGNGYIADDRSAQYWHIDNGADDFHPAHLMGKNIADVCDYLLPKFP